MKNENGAGSVYKLQGKRRKPWIARITTGYDKDGKQLRKTIGTFATKREGQEALLKYNAKPMLFNEITFKELMKMWWDIKKDAYSERSKKLWEYRLDNFEELYEYKITNITLLQLQNLFDTTFKEKSYAYRNILKSGLNMIFDYAVKNDLIESNKVQYIELGKNKKVLKRKIFHDWEIKKLWVEYEEQSLSDTLHNAAVCVLILIYTGLRINELLNLKTENIDLETASFKIVKSKTDAGKRIIPISLKILPIFKKIYNHNNDYFISNAGKEWSYHSFRNNFIKMLNSLDIEEHTIHDTRHTFASLLNNVNANKTSITKLIGHTDFNLTENIYTHKDLEELRKAIDLLN